MKKRILSLLLVLCLVVGLLPVVALAADKPAIQINYYNSSRYVTPGGSPLYLVNHDNSADTSNPKILGFGAANANNWNVKIEYPVDGIPTITLKDVDIKNTRPLHFSAKTRDDPTNPDIFGTAVTSDFRVILEGTNKVASTEPNNAYPIFFNVASTSTVTFTGDGSLEVSCTTNNVLLRSKGNLILDDVDISLDAPPVEDRRCMGIEAVGDMTVTGGSLRITGYNPYEVDESDDTWGKFRPLTYGLKVGGDLTIENGADVKVYAATNNEDINAYPVEKLINVAGTFTIEESDVELAILAGSNETVLGKDSAPTVDVNFAGAYTVVTSATNGTYDPNTKTFTAPAETQEYANITNATLSDLKYFKVSAAPAPTTAEFGDSRIIAGNDLTLYYRIPKEQVDALNGTQVKIVRAKESGSEESTVLLNTLQPITDGGVVYYAIPYAGIAAKEMLDEVSMTVCDANGDAVSDTKTDSVYAYAKRMIGGGDDKLDTLLADMLCYGAMAQELFDYKANTLVTEDVDLSAATDVMANCADSKATVTPAEGVSANAYMGTSFVLEYNIAMAMKISSVLGDGCYAKVTFTNYKGVAQEVATVNSTKATDGNYVFSYNGLVAADGRCQVTWEFFNAENTKMLTVVDSMEQYVGRNIDQLTYLDKLMNYSDSAEAYFTSAN